MRSTLFVLFLAGCPSAPPLTDEDASQPADGAGAADLASAGGCSPKCGGLTPICNDQGHCVGCAKDGGCPMGSYCKVINGATAQCTVGCTSDITCANAQKCCGGQCTDT